MFSQAHTTTDICYQLYWANLFARFAEMSYWLLFRFNSFLILFIFFLLFFLDFWPQDNKKCSHKIWRLKTKRKLLRWLDKTNIFFGQHTWNAMLCACKNVYFALDINLRFSVVVVVVVIVLVVFVRLRERKIIMTSLFFLFSNTISTLNDHGKM